ncbi:MAG: A/G-specific adenine glycosylase, partial [Oscillospiraceae bacterium]
MNQDALSQLTPLLLDWYAQNARSLPWRTPTQPSAYHTWVSEIMLQQTRVTAVLGYYHRFMAAFPTVQDLAAADPERLLKLWEGLGYYSRARNLQKAAQVLVTEYGGVFPASYDALLTLPGIGDYTAGAILSMALGQRVPAVDGNVLRVAARVTDCHEDVTDPRVRKLFRARIAAVLPEASRTGAYNQALMDLGATICLPNGAPLCDSCPARALCLGRQAGTAAALPVKTPKKARRIEEKTVLLLLSPEGVALGKRAETGLLAGLWEFPNRPGTLDEAAVGDWVLSLGLIPVQWEKKLSATHIFTHVEWHMTGFSLRVKSAPPPEGLLWADSDSLRRLAVPSAFSKFSQETQVLL